jgi:hypothetical protein
VLWAYAQNHLVFAQGRKAVFVGRRAQMIVFLEDILDAFLLVSGGRVGLPNGLGLLGLHKSKGLLVLKYRIQKDDNTLIGTKNGLFFFKNQTTALHTQGRRI